MSMGSVGKCGDKGTGTKQFKIQNSKLRIFPQRPMPNSPCPIPHAQCPMPDDH